MSLQLPLQTQANASVSLPARDSFSFQVGSSQCLGFHSSTFRNPLLPLWHRSNAKRPIPVACVVAEYSVVGDHASESSPAEALRRTLNSPGIHQCPACFDALSAKLVERAGFQCSFSSGFSISGARLALPDTGLVSYGEMLDQGRQITEAVSIPVISDADTGYGNAMNVKRTVKGFIKAGFARIVLEDQLAVTHQAGKWCREEAVMRIRAAIDAREESGSDIVIVARTDARQAASFDEALWRTRAFADAGADVLFIDALTSKQEMKAFCETAPLVPKLANMLEGGGKTPVLDPFELQDIGYKLVIYPLSLIGVSIQAMQDALCAIKSDHIPPPGSMPSFEEIKEILGFDSYYDDEKRYATGTYQLPSREVSSGAFGIQKWARDNKGQNPGYPIDEPKTPDIYGNYSDVVSRVNSIGFLSRMLRIKITGRDGVEKVDARIPAGYLEGIANLVPALDGVNFKALLDEAADEVGVKLLLDFTEFSGDRTQVFLE